MRGAFKGVDGIEHAGGALGIVGVCLACADMADELALMLKMGDLLVKLTVEIVEQAVRSCA